MSAARVLVVDDDPAVRRLATRILERAGYRIAVAESGREARRCAQDAPPDLVLTDVVMGDGDGLDALVGLRADHAALPVIVMSGAAGANVYLDLALRIGAARVLSKPFTADQLLEAVESVLLAG